MSQKRRPFLGFSCGASSSLTDALSALVRLAEVNGGLAGVDESSRGSLEAGVSWYAVVGAVVVSMLGL